MVTQPSLELAKSLPPRLLRFFQRYPPPALFPHLTSTSTTTTATSIPHTSFTSTPQNFTDSAETISTTPPTDPNIPIAELSAPTSSPISQIPTYAPKDPSIPAYAHDLPYPNPFLPRKNFVTGRWHSPTYGLRKQADLVKLASAHGVVDLLPWTIKKPGEKEARRIERGLRVKGTGVGERVKGKAWERGMKGRLEMRRQAMIDMPRLIQEWKQKGHGRGWKKWPSGKAKK